MVRRVRSGSSMRTVARQFGVGASTVALWVGRAAKRRLDGVDFSDRAPGCVRGWNRLPVVLEQHIGELRHRLREQSILGEYGASAIQQALKTEMSSGVPAIATINRVLSRQGLQDGARRVRRPPPPKGWYLPAVAVGRAEVDCFDWIEDLKIAAGPLVQVLTGTALLGGQVDAWPESKIATETALCRLSGRWQQLGLPDYAQFDNDAVFQGAHQFADTVGRVSRLCLALGVVPVFAPPREHGFQNAIEGFNALWQAKVWQRHHFKDFPQLLTTSAHYVSAHRVRSANRQEQAPARRPFPQGFRFDPHTPLSGTMIFLRRTDDTGRVHLLGRRFEVSSQWPHRLVRCELDLSGQQLRCYALRRRDPTAQPLLNVLPYHRPNKPFRG